MSDKGETLALEYLQATDIASMSHEPPGADVVERGDETGCVFDRGVTGHNPGAPAGGWGVNRWWCDQAVLLEIAGRIESDRAFSNTGQEEEERDWQFLECGKPQIRPFELPASYNR